MTFNGTHKQALVARGLYDQAVAAGWEPFMVKGRPGLAYPVYNVKGNPYRERRWKAIDGERPKYLWLWEKPQQAKYYFLPGTLSAIAQQCNAAYLAGGEPDVLAYRAAGITNTFCWLDGEGSPPSSLANDLAAMGVSVLYYAPDRDVAGMQAAYKVQRLLEGTNVDLVLFKLPGEMGSGYDINNLWLDAGDTFTQRLLALPALDAVDLYLYSQQTGTKRAHAEQNVNNEVERWYKEWQNDVKSHLGQPVVIEGTTQRWHCPLPGHEDKHPSFTITDKQKPGHPWPMCTCGIQDNKNAWGVVAEAVGADSWVAFKVFKAAEAGFERQPRQQTFATTGTDQLPQADVVPPWVDMHDEYRKLRERLEGKREMEFAPVVFPLTVLHKYRGFARFLRRKKVIGVVGVSGGGKTLLIKTMMLILMRAGYDVIWWGPEWDPEEYAEQDLQRVDGMPMDVLDEWEIWKHFEKQGIAEEMSAKYGLAKPGDQQVQKAIAAMRELESIPGRMYVIPDLEKPLDEVCEIAKAITKIKRAEGRDVLAFAFDYVQLAQASGKKDWSWAEGVVGKVKSTCGTADLCGFVSAQVRKKDSENVREGEQLTHGSAQGLSDAQFNLFLTLTPIVDDEGNFTNHSWLGVGKNSRGRKGKVMVYADYEHLAVLDQEVKTTDVSFAGYGDTESNALPKAQPKTRTRRDTDAAR